MIDAPLRYKLTVAYRGTVYHGWQRQLLPGDDTSVAELPTVQNTLRLALQRTVGHPVTVTGASRTDAGVHAVGQAASFETFRHQITPDKLHLAVNARLPADVAVREVVPVPGSFDVITDTVEKAYRYTIYNGRRIKMSSPATSPCTCHRSRGLWMPRPCTPQPCSSSASTTSPASPSRATGVRPRPAPSPRASVRREGDAIHFDVAGTGFLWHQVRIFTGTLIRVGIGKVERDAMPQILAARDRQAAGPTAPPHGLCLQWVRHRELPVEHVPAATIELQA